MSTCHDQHSLHSWPSSGGRGIVHPLHVEKLQKIILPRLQQIFSLESPKYDIYIDYTYIFGINLVHISSLSTF